MRIKNYISAIAQAVAIVMIASCSNDHLAVNRPGEESGLKDAVYMNVSVQLPVGNATRSNTNDNGGSSDGDEVGHDYENKVNEILLVLADRNNKFIAYAEQDGLQNTTSDRISTTQKLNKSTLASYYGDDKVLAKGQEEIYVYVFCNPVEDLKNKIEEVANGDDAAKAAWHGAVCELSETADGNADNEAVWGGKDHKGGFLMSTARAASAKKKIPVNFEDWNGYTSVDKAFSLSGVNNANSDKEIDNDGPVPVERAVARFDFRDASQGNNTYDVVKDKDDKVILRIQLEKMALVNMSSHFHYLRRVSDTGLEDATVTLCGTETSKNYVVDTDAAAKKDNSIITGNKYADHFNFPLGHVDGDGKWSIGAAARNQWFTAKIADVLNAEEDNPEWTGDGDYHIWRYVTENAVPGETQQKNGLTTGIVFRGKMTATADTPASLKDALENAEGTASDAILYSYSNNLYVTWKEVREFALKEGVGSGFYKAVFGTPANVPVIETDAVDAVYSDDVQSPDYLWNKWHNESMDDAARQAAFKNAATGSNFTIYQSSKEDDSVGYYCYYFYWNRHNDNGNDGVMGPMEFAVVRNNVYKLAVTKINRLGHPRNSDDDPDPLDPDDPDEKGDIYLNVSVKVMPWVVRVNNIEF